MTPPDFHPGGELAERQSGLMSRSTSSLRRIRSAEIPAALSELVHSNLAKTPSSRAPDANALLVELERAIPERIG